MNVFDVPDMTGTTVTGMWVYWPCRHGWRRWSDRLIGRRHPSVHGVWSEPTTDAAGSVMTVKWDASGRVTIGGPE